MQSTTARPVVQSFKAVGSLVGNRNYLPYREEREDNGTVTATNALTLTVSVAWQTSTLKFESAVDTKDTQ